ncbi:hypothetical protein NIES970_01120 [[Synechococcus] sp. NIES-970]|nr:hypothetical protein NIES970_01120 [[Synechococcus] sp. NIES-970]
MAEMAIIFAVIPVGSAKILAIAPSGKKSFTINKKTESLFRPLNTFK